MGYDLHITRREAIYDEDGPAISAQDWVSYVNASDELEFPEKSVNGDLFAYWTAAKEKGCTYEEAWFDWFEGCIFTKNPDQD